MKTSDFRREHFEKGRGFRKEDFDAYIAASKKAVRTTYAAYLPCMAAGLLLSLLFSKGVGGFVGNIAAVVAIFAGLIVGGIFNIRAGNEVRRLAAKLGIDRQDVAAARMHVKNGTVAWSGDADPEDTSTQSAPESKATAPRRRKPIPEKPARAVWAAALMILGWIALVALQSLFAPRAAFSANTLYLTAMALLGSGVYLISRRGIKFKLFGVGAGLISVLLRSLSTVIAEQQRRAVGLDISRLFRSVAFDHALTENLICMLIPLGVALLVSVLCRGADQRQSARRTAWAASGAYIACCVADVLIRSQDLLRSSFVGILTVAIGVLSETACLLLVAIALHALANIPHKRVRLRGIGLVWAWFATVGMAAVLVSTLVIVTGISGMRYATANMAQLMLAICGLVGYIMLLCRRRIGLYFILIGGGVMLGAQLASSLSLAVISGGDQLATLISSIIGTLNPLFAYFAVRAGYVGKRSVSELNQ